MNVLTTRAMSYLDETANSKEIILTIFVPFKAKRYKWQCGFVTDPSIHPKIVYGLGSDFLRAFVDCLRIARLYLETEDRSRRVHWRGMPDCGLPPCAAAPSSVHLKDMPPSLKIEGSMDVLATRAVGFLDESGVAIERRLTVFVPSKAENDEWVCGFTFDAPPFTLIRYGVGADFIEALLDALASARAMYEETTPKGCEPLVFNFNCDDLPYKVGRSFWMGRSRESLPDAPDVSDV